MKVHPVPRKRNITLRCDIVSALSQANSLTGRQKKLRRLPHIFAKVLELPFNSDADVSIEETSDSFRFVIPTDDAGNNIRADTVEIYPGVTKIVIRGDNVLDSSLGEFELDLWRFRLPPSTLPELATADFADGELVVTVPKDPDEEEVDDDGIGNSRKMRYVYFLLVAGAADEERSTRYPTTGVQEDAVTVGEALEAVALKPEGNKPIEQSDAAAIQAAEARATGRSEVVPGGVGAEAQCAASINAQTDDKTTLRDVLKDATSKLIEDKAAKREDAEGVVGAEIRNTLDLATHPGGVAASITTASDLNEF